MQNIKNFLTEYSSLDKVSIFLERDQSHYKLRILKLK